MLLEAQEARFLHVQERAADKYVATNSGFGGAMTPKPCMIGRSASSWSIASTDSMGSFENTANDSGKLSGKSMPSGVAAGAVEGAGDLSPP